MSEITNFHDPESYDETPDSSEDEGFDRTSSNASDYVYHRQVELRQALLQPLRSFFQTPRCFFVPVVIDGILVHPCEFF